MNRSGEIPANKFQTLAIGWVRIKKNYTTQ